MRTLKGKIVRCKYCKPSDIDCPQCGKQGYFRLGACDRGCAESDHTQLLCHRWVIDNEIECYLAQGLLIEAEIKVAQTTC